MQPRRFFGSGKYDFEGCKDRVEAVCGNISPDGGTVIETTEDQTPVDNCTLLATRRAIFTGENYLSPKMETS